MSDPDSGIVAFPPIDWTDAAITGGVIFGPNGTTLIKRDPETGVWGVVEFIPRILSARERDALADIARWPDPGLYRWRQKSMQKLEELGYVRRTEHRFYGFQCWVITPRGRAVYEQFDS
jgi:hypothetical protein